jgi:hypothetical protein
MHYRATLSKYTNLCLKFSISETRRRQRSILPFHTQLVIVPR